MALRLDLNFSQRTEGFIRIAKALEDLNLAWLECDIHDPEALALVRRSTTTPIASLETIHGLQAFKPFIANYSCDVAIVDVQWNGMWESVRIASLCDAFEIDCAPHNFAGPPVELHQRAFLRRRSRTTASWNTTSTRCRGATTCSPTRR